MQHTKHTQNYTYKPMTTSDRSQGVPILIENKSEAVQRQKREIGWLHKTSYRGKPNPTHPHVLK